jgi:hypothetical protein
MNTSFPIAVVEALRKRIRCLESWSRRKALLPFGIKAIDELRTRGDAPSPEFCNERANSELSPQARRGEAAARCDYPSHTVEEFPHLTPSGPFELIRCRGRKRRMVVEWNM